ncbi:hypothetical protein C7I55_18065 [Sphingomonas deserti]|uniref:Right handed beta helix domain-containing protein n=1 Tax=Allosphingosinicella deserti TaxID=2116704 RepID=A0A2P7QK64_9SPHN|nr:hypothetical protein C7I55_18065 [Sphingomonas deserti]
MAAFGFAAPVSAQATRTWVSGGIDGDDVNPCSRTAPCKTFAGAISKTAAGGEIDCLSPGGFGTLTITKSITIDCSGTYGSVLNSGGINGFVINDSATATPGTVDVILRGVSINGAGTTPGLNGIRFISGRSLVVENVMIQNQKSGNGISFQPQAAAVLHLENVTITNGNNGVLVQPTGLGSARVSARHLRIHNNSGAGFRADTSGSGSTGVRFTLEDTDLQQNANGVQFNGPPTAADVRGTLTRVNVSNNSGNGIAASGSRAVVAVTDSTITGNAIGVVTSASAVVNTYTDNALSGNASDGVFGAALPPR